MLTDAEHEAMETTATLANQIRRLIGSGPTAEADWQEAVNEIHVIQHRIMAQSAARAHPEMYRLMGGRVGEPPAIPATPTNEETSCPIPPIPPARDA